MRRFYFFIRKFFILSVATVLILCCANANAADDKTPTYTREELETKLDSDLQEKKQKSEAAQAAIDELQKELDTYGMGPLLRVSEKGGFYKDPEYEKLQRQVYHGEITDEEYKKQKKQLEKKAKDREKELKKQIKEQQKIVDDYNKEYEKGMKEINKTLEKQDKLADKAEKLSEKLAEELKECEHMAANPEKRQECAEKAKKKYGLSDEQQAALDNRKAEQEAALEAAKAAEEKRQEQVAEKDKIPGVEQKKGSEDDPNKEIGEGGNADKANGTAPGLKGVCANAGSGNTKVFAQIACKALMFLVDLRIIAYIISGFGMVAFAYAAVFNKISWKHFSQIAIGLFLLSMIGPFITYFTGETSIEANLQYGNYLGGNYNPVVGTKSKKDTDIDGGMKPTAIVQTQQRKWDFKKDLVGSIKSGLNTVRGAYNTVQGVKSTLKTVSNNADVIANAIKNNGGGVDGILGAVGNISGAMNNIGYAYSTGMSNMLSGIDNVANNAQDMTATQQQRNINAKERAAGGASNLISGWINSEEGGKSLEKDFAQMNNVINKGAAVAGKATTAGYEGQKIGGGGALGDVLGGLMGAGEAIVGADSANTQLKREAEIEAQRQKEQEEWNKNAEAAKKQQEANRRHAEEVQRQNQQQDKALYNKPLENKLFNNGK